MNQLCKVCGEPAAGYHFGAFTCEGCKSFFGRTYNNLAALGECKNNGQCVINKKNRTSCKSCRLKKCLMVGMSKSGSRYGRRSNWFKIHCLIQDQAEMTSRLAEQGVIGSNTNGGSLAHAFSENKDLVSQYKQDNFRETNSASAARVSSSGASPSSSDSSGGGALSSPYSSLFEVASKANGFSSRFGASSPQTSLHTQFQQAALPLSPVSPNALSPLNAASRFFFHYPTAAGNLFSKGINGLPKLYNGDLSGYAAACQSRFLPLHAMNPVLKKCKEDNIDPQPECFADTPEQERPLDLTLKRGVHPSESLSVSCLKTLKNSCNADHDSGFSPSSNEENNNTSPLDLTATKRRATESPLASRNNEVKEDEETGESDEEEHDSQLQQNHNK